MSGQLHVFRVLRPPLVLSVAALAAGIALLGVLSWFGTVHWVLELLSHFRLYYCLFGGILAVAALALRLYGPAIVVGAVALINGVAAWPHISLPLTLINLPPPMTLTNPPPTVRVLWANLHNWSTDLEALRHLIEREKPDIAVFTELAATHEPTLRQMRDLLPFQSAVPNGNPLDLMLLAKRPPEALHFDLAMGDKAPLLIARLCPGGVTCLTLLGLHTSRPFPYADGARDRQLAYAASMARRHVDRGERVVLVGDLNVTPFSPVYDRFLAQSGLVDTASMAAVRVRAATSTWWVGHTGIGLPIDHVMLGPRVVLVERRLGSPIRSDHLPLIVDLWIAP